MCLGESVFMEEVIIVGAGPVGLAAAIGLVNKGVSVKVIEAETQFAEQPKASTIHPPTLEVFDEWGIIDKVRNLSLEVDSLQYWDRSTSELIVEFKLDVLKGETNYPFRFQIEQYRLMKIFYEYLTNTDKAKIYFNSKLVDLKVPEDSVVLYIETPKGVEELSCKFLIGADGASSIVRQKMDIPFEKGSNSQNHLLICTTNDFSSYYSGISSVSYFYDPKEWIASIRNPDFWKFSLPLGLNVNREDLDDEFIQNKIREFTKTKESFNVYHWAPHRVHQRVAKYFIDGRVAIIGDAAHLNTTLGGMGMNSGIHDAYFLIKDLVKVINGEGDLDILEEFDTKRQLITREIIQKHTIKNEKEANQIGDYEKQKENLRKTLASNELTKSYLMRTSMIESFNLMNTDIQSIRNYMKVT